MHIDYCVSFWPHGCHGKGLLGSHITIPHCYTPVQDIKALLPTLFVHGHFGPHYYMWSLVHTHAWYCTHTTPVHTTVAIGLIGEGHCGDCCGAEDVTFVSMASMCVHGFVPLGCYGRLSW